LELVVGPLDLSILIARRSGIGLLIALIFSEVLLAQFLEALDPNVEFTLSGLAPQQITLNLEILFLWCLSTTSCLIVADELIGASAIVAYCLTISTYPLVLPNLI